LQSRDQSDRAKFANVVNKEKPHGEIVKILLPQQNAPPQLAQPEQPQDRQQGQLMRQPHRRVELNPQHPDGGV
jgi:hypothetical protein